MFPQMNKKPKTLLILPFRSPREIMNTNMFFLSPVFPLENTIFTLSFSRVHGKLLTLGRNGADAASNGNLDDNL